jgi:hypothetical protein
MMDNAYGLKFQAFLKHFKLKGLSIIHFSIIH